MAVPHQPRRRFRFSLRTLLALVVVIAIPLAWVAKERRQSAFERSIAEELRVSGFATVVLAGPYDSLELYSLEKPQGWWRDTARRVLGERILSLIHKGPSDIDLSPLTYLTNFRALEVGPAKNCDLAPLPTLTKLEWLHLNHTQVRDLAPLSAMRSLRQLYVYGAQVSDVGPLASLINLTTLGLNECPLSDLTPLANLTKLEVLSLDESLVSDLAPLAELANLEELWIRRTKVSELTYLAGLSKLKLLRAKESRITKEQVEALKLALPNCQIEHDPFP